MIHAQVFRSEVILKFATDFPKKNFLILNVCIKKRKSRTERWKKQCEKILIGKSTEEHMGIHLMFFSNSAVDLKEYQ